MTRIKASQMVLGNRSQFGNGKMVNVSDTLKNIVQIIRQYPPLDKEEENSLIEKFQHGDVDAGQKVILHNQSIVYQLAKDYGKNEEEIRDFVMEGNFGLHDALKRFDCGLNLKFYTYARWWIMAAMSRYASTDNAMIRVPDYAGAVRCAKKMERIFFNKEGRNPTLEELKEMVESEMSEVTGKMKYDVPHIEALYDIVFVSSDAPISDDDSDYLIDESSEYVERTQSFNEYEEQSECEYNKAILKPLLGYLDFEERELMLKLYKIGKYKDTSKQSICDEYGLKPADIDNIENQLLTKMREAAKKMVKMGQVI